MWEAAGRISSKVTKACIVNWMLMGVFLTRDKLFKFKKASSPICIYCDPSQSSNTEEILCHHLLICSRFSEIRKPYIETLLIMNPIFNFATNHKIMTISILDPESKFLPDEIRENCSDIDETYRIARDFIYNLFKKRKFLLTEEYEQK